MSHLRGQISRFMLVRGVIYGKSETLSGKRLTIELL